MLVVALLFALPACVPIYIDREQYQSANVVSGYLPQNPGAIALRNQALLTKPIGKAPNDVRLFDPAVDKDRTPAPGLDAKGQRRKDLVTFQEEWDYNRSSPKAPPEHCVAMSGGGIRSASFNIGVLSALRDSGRLAKTDVLSAVSGGAYALSWYYAQHFNDRLTGSNDPARRAKFDEEILELGSTQNHYLATNAAIFNLVGYTGVGIANTLMIPANFVMNGILGWHLNTTPGRSIYEDRLQRIFQSREGHVSDRIPFTELGSMIRERQLPYFIVNTTALIEDSSDYLGAPLYNRIYEFTPNFFGADALGRFRYPVGPEDPLASMSFGRAVSISGAALDGTKLISGSSQRTLWSLLNQDLGYYLHNPAMSDKARLVHKTLPFPLYYFHHYPRHLDGTHVYLSDGGHSENLGAYGLVRRLCQNIVIVDAEHDPGYEFEAYYVLKRALRRDMNVELKIPELEEIAAHERSLREARIDAVIRNEREPEPRSKEYEYESLPPIKTIDILDSFRWKAVAAKPVMQGTIGHLPYPGRKSDELNVEYIKLAYWTEDGNCEAVKDYYDCCSENGSTGDRCLAGLEQRDKITGNTLKPRLQSCVADADAAKLMRTVQGALRPDYPRIYFCRTKESRELRTSRYSNLSHFPQEPTTDQDFGELQFKAYRQLGFDLAKDRLKDARR